MIGFFVKLVGGQIVKYGSKKAAEAAAKNIGGKIIKNVTKEVKEQAIPFTKLKNNPTIVDKIKAKVLGIKPKQSKSMPRPGVSDKPSGIAAGKLAKEATEAAVRNKTAITLLGGIGLYNAIKGESQTKAKADTPPTPSRKPKDLIDKMSAEDKKEEKKFNLKTGGKGTAKERLDEIKKEKLAAKQKKLVKGSKGVATGLKMPTADQVGLKKLPTPVRNKMGYMYGGGMAKKPRMSSMDYRKGGLLVISIDMMKKKKKGKKE